MPVLGHSSIHIIFHYRDRLDSGRALMVVLGVPYGEIVRAAVLQQRHGVRFRNSYPYHLCLGFCLGVAIAALAPEYFAYHPIGLGMDMDLIVQLLRGSGYRWLWEHRRHFCRFSFGRYRLFFFYSDLAGRALAIIFVHPWAVLIWRPWGLFGTEMRF